MKLEDDYAQWILLTEEEVAVGYFKGVSRHLPGETE
jgi:hypothetical protein